MVAKTKKRRGEKSQAVRDYLKRYPKAPVADVVSDLKKHGITISPAIVYNIRATAKKMASKPGRKPAAPDTNGAAEHGSKSQAVRAAIKELGRKIPAQQVVDHLAAKGIPVSLGLVVKVKSKITARRKAVRLGRPAGAARTPTASSNAEQHSYENLVATKELADRLGGTESLRKTLDVLEKLR